LLRRARIPFKSTQGFHPTPRLVFALSLPLGVVGRNEVAELELTEPADADALRACMADEAPPGLTFKSACVVDLRTSAKPRRAVYCLPLPRERADEVADIARELQDEPKVWVDRLRPRPRQLNVRPYIRQIAVADAVLLLDLWVTPSGTARADELLRLLGVKDVHDDGAVLERTDLEIHDEVAPGQPDEPPVGPPQTAPLEHAAALSVADEEPSTPATWGGSPAGPVVE
jgi:radical SAM-linked protein